MKLAHIETICEISRHRFNMSEAAVALHRSQPALSRQVSELERELGVRVFLRTRNRIAGLTPEGAKIMAAGQRIAKEVEDLHLFLSGEPEGGLELRIATTHTHARYTLPSVIKRFNERSPKVVLNLRQGGDPAQCAQLVADGEADIGITTEIDKLPRATIAIPAFSLSRCLLAPRSHPITREKLTLRNIARYPLIAYARPPGDRWLFGSTFTDAGLEPHVVLSAIDADVSKTYVGLGLGIAVLASVAYNPEQDQKLVALNVDHLFRPGSIVVVLRQGAPISRHTLSFLSLFAPHLEERRIRGWINGDKLDRAQMLRLAPTASFDLNHSVSAIV